MCNTPNILNNFLARQVTNGMSQNTIDNYKADLILMLKYLKKEKCNMETNVDNIEIFDISIDFIKEITLQDLNRFMDYLSGERGNSNSTRARRIASIKCFYDYLKGEEIVYQNIALELKSPKIPKRDPVFITQTESEKLLSAIDGLFKERNYAIILLFLSHGLRISELVSINIEDIKDGRLTIIGKGNKQRHIFLTPACLNAIEEYLKIRNSNESALFLSKYNTRISKDAIEVMIKKYINKAGIDKEGISAHKLRHSFASMMVENGVDIGSLRDMLGHSSISTTNIYLHVHNEQLKKAANMNPLANLGV